MRTNPAKLLAISVMLLAAAASSRASARPSEATGKEVLASVNGEPITLDDLFGQLRTLHQDMNEPQAMVESPDPSALLERLIGVRLVLQEAVNIGLDELPEVVDQLNAGRTELLKRAVVEEATKDVTQGDPQDVERFFREAVREVKVESVLFPSKEEATFFEASLKGDVDFGAQARSMVEQGKALAVQEPEYMVASRLQPEVMETVLGLQVGEVSSPFQLAGGLTVVKLLEVRYPENAEARAQAEQQALTIQRQLALNDYAGELRKRYAEVDQELLDSLDYNEFEALEGLQKDERVVVEIKGGEAIRVKELTARLEKEAFHGMERAMTQGRITEEVPAVLDRVIQERAVFLEAERLELEKRPEFSSMLRAQKEGLLFGTFVSKVINPKVEMTNDELRAYHKAHLSEYSGPEMMRLDNLAFHRRENAEAALEKLRKGADLKWMRANTGGQVDVEEIEVTWNFDGKLLSVPDLPEEVRGAVAGASSGDFRFCAQPSGSFHVLWVMESFPAQPQTYETVKKQIATKVFIQKRRETLEFWMEQLREASEVEVFADEEKIKALLGLGSADS